MVQFWLQLTQQLSSRLQSDETRRRNAGDKSWELNAALVRVEMALEAVRSAPSPSFDSSNSSPTTEDALLAELEKEEEALDQLVRETVLNRANYNNVVHDGNPTKDESHVNGIDPSHPSHQAHARAPRLTSLSHRMEEYAQYKAFRHFLEHGTLLSPSAPCFIAPISPNAPHAPLDSNSNAMRRILTDEEYISGACLGLCAELANHAVRFATLTLNSAEHGEHPRESIHGMSPMSPILTLRRARDIVSLILEELLHFDFRNGPLRRKYDGLKYHRTTLETVLYELSVAGAMAASGGHAAMAGPLRSLNVSDLAISDGRNHKRMKIHDGKNEEEGSKENTAMDTDTNTTNTTNTPSNPPPTSITTIPHDEIHSLRLRFDHRDTLRETLIKSCRDAQKAAKQAIYALHRKEARSDRKALDLIRTCENVVREKLMPILEEEPGLRGGSFSAVLEEYVEGVLFYGWLHGKEDITMGNRNATEHTPQNDKPNTQHGRTADLPAGTILLFHELPLPVSPEEYIGGLCDLTGEINRYAQTHGTIRNANRAIQSVASHTSSKPTTDTTDTQNPSNQLVQQCLTTTKSIQKTLKMIGKLPGQLNKKLPVLSRSVEKLERMMYEMSLMEMTGKGGLGIGIKSEVLDRSGGDGRGGDDGGDGGDGGD